MAGTIAGPGLVSGRAPNFLCRRVNALGNKFSLVRGITKKTLLSSRGTEFGKLNCVSGTASTEMDIPTVSDTKEAFLQAYKRPIPSLYNTMVQELLVQHHLIRYNRSYRYDPLFALGFVTVFDQLMDGYPYGEDAADLIFKAFIGALDEDSEKYRADAKAVESWAQSLDNPEQIFSFKEEEGLVQKELQGIVAAISSEGFHYSRFFAVGMFRILEIASAFDPATLDKFCTALGVPKTSVERDLDVYRGLLNKLTQAKDLLNDFLERERNKQAEREKEKAQKA